MSRGPLKFKQSDVARPPRGIVNEWDEVYGPLPVRLHTTYIVGYGPYVKIGYSTNLKDRLSNLQVSSPAKLNIYGAIPHDVEYKLHHRFRTYRSRGDWFWKQGRLAEWIAAGCPWEVT